MELVCRPPIREEIELIVVSYRPDILYGKIERGLKVFNCGKINGKIEDRRRPQHIYNIYTIYNLYIALKIKTKTANCLREK